MKPAYAIVLFAIGCLAVPRLSAQDFQPIVTNSTVNVTNNAVVAVAETEVLETVVTTNLATYVGPETKSSGYVAANWDVDEVPTNTVESVHGRYDVLDVSSFIDCTDCFTNWIEELDGYGVFTTNYWTLQTNVVDFVTNHVGQYDIVIDGNSEQDSVVEFSTANPSTAYGFVTVSENDTVEFRTGNATVRHNIEGLRNAGTFQVFAYSGSSNGRDCYTTIASAVTNLPGATLHVEVATTGRNQNDAALTLPFEGFVNHGDVHMIQKVSDRNTATLSLSGDGGTFVNNGLVWLSARGSRSDGRNSTFAGLYLPAKTHNIHGAFMGTGRIWMEERDKNPSHPRHVRINSSSTWLTLTNDVAHAIEGSGLIEGGICLVNAGLVMQTGTNGHLDLRQPTMYNGFSSSYTSWQKRIINLPTGRMVAAGGGGRGLFIGNTDTVSTRPNGFENYGLLEARTGAFISFRKNTTQGEGTSTSIIPEILVQSGTWAGGGEFHTLRPLQLDDNAVLSPGDLHAEDAFGSVLTNGTGVSTFGLLTFTNALILSSATTLDFQFRDAEEGRGMGYDSVHVGGPLTLDGVLDVSAPSGLIREGDYTLFTCPPGELTDNGLELGSIPDGSGTPIIDVDADAGIVSLFFPPRRTLVIIR
ncbi:MAG: hypothetical protein ACOX9C_12610 [Kiritimatiellia bacterium]|jgi:hypothetical protein